MRVRRAGLLVGLAWALATVAWAEDPGDLRGLWTAVAATRDGKPADDVVGHTLSVRDDAFEIRVKDRVLYRGTVTLDASEVPARIDFRHDAPLEGRTWLGILRRAGPYVVEICDNAPDPARPRPTRFEAPAGSGYVLIRFRRAGN